MIQKNNLLRKYQSKVSKQTGNQYLDYFIDPSFQGVNRLFILPLENGTHRTRHKGYFLSNVEIINYSNMIDN